MSLLLLFALAASVTAATLFARWVHRRDSEIIDRESCVKQPLALVAGTDTPVAFDPAPDDMVLIRHQHKEKKVISNMIISQDANGNLVMTPKSSAACAGLMEGCQCQRCKRWDFKANRPKGKVLVVVGCGQCGGWCGTCFMEETDSRYPEAAKHELETGEDARYIEEWQRTHPNG